MKVFENIVFMKVAMRGVDVFSPTVPLKAEGRRADAAEALINMQKGEFKKPPPPTEEAQQGPSKLTASTPSRQSEAGATSISQDVSQLSEINVTGDSQLDTSLMHDVMQR